MPQEISFEKLSRLPEPCVVIIRSGRIGDIVACEPVIRYAKKLYPVHKVAWVVRKIYKSALACHPDLDFIVDYEATKIRDILEFLHENATRFPMINLNPSRTYCFLSRQGLTTKSNPDSQGYKHHNFGSLLEGFSRAAGLPPLTDTPRFYIPADVSIPVVPKPYVTFHCSSEDKSKNWPLDNWKKLYEYFISRGIRVVEVGNKPLLNYISPHYFKIEGADTLLQCAKLINDSSFFVGLDSGFSHIANALQVNGLVILGKLAGCSWDRLLFTGPYREERHKIRPGDHNKAASAVEVKDVIARCEELLPQLKNQNPSWTGAVFSITPYRLWRLFREKCQPSPEKALRNNEDKERLAKLEKLLDSRVSTMKNEIIGELIPLLEVLATFQERSSLFFASDLSGDYVAEAFHGFMRTNLHKTEEAPVSMFV